MNKMLLRHILPFLIQMNHVWSSYLENFLIGSTKTLYYHKEKMDDHDYEVIMSLCHQVNDLGFNYWNGSHLPQTGNALVVLDDVNPDYIKNLLKQDGIQKSLFNNIWIIHSNKNESHIQEYFSKSKARVGLNANIFIVITYLERHNVIQVIGTGTNSVKYKQHGILQNLDIPTIIEGTQNRMDFEGTALIANYGTHCFVEQDGTVSGILPDVLRTAAYLMNLTLTFQKSKKENIGIWHKK